MKRAIGILGFGLLLMAAPATFGGWAVITVQELPEYLETGRPSTLAFTVRQHGVAPLEGLSPSVRIQRGSVMRLFNRDRVDAVPSGAPGRYEVVIPAQEAGEVQVTIDLNWHEAKMTLLPLRVVAAGQESDPTPVSERGRQLFIAKGCVTCHLKRDDGEMIGRHVADIGPALTNRQFPSDWLVAKLADPAKYRAPDQWGMPTLNLSDEEIAALTRYVNGQSRGSLRSGNQ